MLKGESNRSVKQLVWNNITNVAFLNLKKTILNITSRAQPNFNKEFIATTHASNETIGAILAQVNEEDKEQMICAFSKRLDIQLRIRSFLLWLKAWSISGII